MVVPFAIFYAIAHGTAASSGWGMAMPTDLAFALGMLVVAARSLPSSMRPFILTLAIVDDLLTVIVVGIFYVGDLSALPFVGIVVCVVAMLALERLAVRSLVPYAMLGALVWVFAYAAGVHPALAGALLGILVPARAFHRPAAVSAAARRIADETANDPNPPDADAAAWLELSRLSGEAVSPLGRIEHATLPWVNLFVLPAFALANAGVRITSAAWSDDAAVVLIVALVVARLVGKLVGVVGGTLVARRIAPSSGSTAALGPRALAGAALAAGAPFTVSLFVASTTFADDPALLAAARLGVLISVAVCAVGAVVVLRRQSATEPR
jgi:NhaA family Na+:H+ antiporter